MESQAHNFTKRADVALHDMELQKALGMLKGGLAANRAVAVAAMPEFNAVRDAGRYIKEHTLAHLDYYLEEFERNCVAAGGHVQKMRYSVWA